LSEPLHVALIWHMHQPLYKDPLTQQYAAPWVRLHAARDYLRMAEILARYPDVHATFNFVPVLVEQLLDYASSQAVDRHLALSRLVCWDAEQKGQALAAFFDVDPEHVLGRNAHYMQLAQLRDDVEGEAMLLSNAYYRDLVASFNLAWLPARWAEQAAELRELRAKGRRFSPAEIETILDVQTETLRRVMPAYVRMRQAGQVEITTSPYYHPVLPLLYDISSARDIRSDVVLPQRAIAYPEDARAQLELAVEFHRDWSGVSPSGLWPPEGGVCAAMLADVAGCGFSWLATDENVLARSLGTDVQRDAAGHVINPELLYRPYRMEVDGRSLALLFRDRFLSDQIGFTYGHWQADRAVDDLIGRLHVIRDRLGRDAGRHLVVIALDGENCWDAYEENGDAFLERLYRALSEDPTLRAVSVGEHLQQSPADVPLQHLASGSWIPSGFETWVGEPEQNAAWDLLARTREHALRWLDQANGSDLADSAERIWRHLYASEGSDWFWWCFLPNQVNGRNPYHDLFLRHIAAVYQITGCAGYHEIVAQAVTESMG